MSPVLLRFCEVAAAPWRSVDRRGTHCPCPSPGDFHSVSQGQSLGSCVLQEASVTPCLWLIRKKTKGSRPGREVGGSTYGREGRQAAVVGDQVAGVRDNDEALFRKLACMMSLKEWYLAGGVS